MKNQTLRIEAVSITEIETLLEWRMRVLHTVFSDFQDVDWNSQREQNCRYYVENIPNGRHVALFAEYGDRIVGCGGVCFQTEMPSPENPSGRCAFIMNVYVDPEFRHMDVGSRIVRKLIGISESRGVGKISLETTECARHMYRSLGFEPMPEMMKYDKTNDR